MNYLDTISDLVDSLNDSEKGKIYFTLERIDTGTHRTFRLQKSDFANGAIVIGILSGSDNESDYTNFAFLNLDSLTVNVWKRYRTQEFYSKLSGILTRLLIHRVDHKNLRITHSGNCFRCGRTLTTPESIKSGIGPVCAEKLNN